MSEPPVLLSKWYEYTKWVIARVDQFPKNQRFILGQRLVDGVLDIQECLIEGAYSRGAKKRDQLSTANRKIEVLRWLIRLAHERELVSARQFAFSCEQLSECGRMLGGWIRQAGGTDEAA
jgi:hypothetical protein